MRKVYFVLAALTTLALIVQMYLAGVGAMAKPQTDSSFDVHKFNGMVVLPTLIVLGTIVAVIVRAGARQVGLTILPLGLIALQILINTLGGRSDDTTSTAQNFVLGLHAVNGMLTMAVAGLVTNRAMKIMRGAPANKSAVQQPVTAATQAP